MTTKNNKKIAIVGGTIWGNRGAEAMLATTIGRIKAIHPTTEFFIFSYYPSEDRALIDDPTIHVLSAKPMAVVFHHFIGAVFFKLLTKAGISTSSIKFLRTAECLYEADALLDIGGITFSDGRELFLLFNILTIWPAMILGTPVIKMAQAVGPFNHRLNRVLSKYFLSRCEKIFVRGEQSKRHISNLDFPKGKASEAADIAFLYQSTYSLSRENDEAVSSLIKTISTQKKKGKKIIVIAPSILVNAKLKKRGMDYEGLLLAAIYEFDPQKYFFVILPNATRQGSKKKHNNDLVLINTISKRLQDDEVSGKKGITPAFITYDINTASIRSIISGADLILTSRYHAMISGLALSVPTVVLGWSHKYRETMEAFDLSLYTVNVNSDRFELVERIHDALQNEKTIREKMNAVLPHIREDSEKQFHYLAQFLR